MATRILMIEDDARLGSMVAEDLGRSGLDVSVAGTASEGLARLAREPFDLVLLDLMLPDRPGLALLPEMREKRPDVPVIVVTAYSSVESAISAMKDGAFHYVP